MVLLTVHKENNSFFFGERVHFRLSNLQKRKLSFLVNEFPSFFDNRSHVVRCAINEFYANFKKKMKKKKKSFIEFS